MSVPIVRQRQLAALTLPRPKTRAAGGVLPATINRELAFLRRVLNVAVADRLVDANPVLSRRRGGAFAKENNRRVRYLEAEDEARLRKALGEEHWPKVAVALHAGFRRSNVFPLRWADDVNFDAGTIRAHEPKGGRDYHVPMNEDLRVILRALPSRLRSPYVFPSDTARTALDSQDFINRMFLPALVKARVEDLHWHDLRHSSRAGSRWRAWTCGRFKNSWGTPRSR